MEHPTFVNRRRVLLIVAGLFGFVLLVTFLSTYSLLTVTSAGSEEKAVTVIDNESEEEIKRFTLKDGSKTILLKRAAYNIEVTKDNQLSLYKKSLDLLSKNHVDVELLPQKASLYLGQNSLGCAKQQEDKDILFYSCKPSSTLAIFSSSGGQGNLPNTENAPLSQPGELTEPVNTSGALKSYGNQFLAAVANNSVLTIRTREGKDYNPNPEITIPDFQGTVSDGVFSVAPGSENFAIYDNSKNMLLSFRSLSDKNPLRIEVPKEKIGPEHYQTSVVAGKDYTYLFHYSTTFDIHELEEESEEERLAETSPKILVYNTADGRLVEEHSLPEEWRIRGDISAGPGNKVIFYLSGNLHEQTYLLEGETTPKLIDGLGKAPQQSCWKDSDSFYYLTDASSNIFLYSLSKQASFLLYGPLPEGTTAGNLNCEAGKLYFTVEHNDDGETNEFKHFTLGDSSHTGARLEAVLPEYLSTVKDTFKISQTASGANVEVIYDDPVDGAATPQNIRQQAEELLKSKGIKLEGLNITLNF